VEHDPREIWENVKFCVEGVLEQKGIGGERIASVGITNQRETTILWNRETGEPYHNAIVWNDVRTSGIVEELVERHGEMILR